MFGWIGHPDLAAGVPRFQEAMRLGVGLRHGLPKVVGVTAAGRVIARARDNLGAAGESRRQCEQVLPCSTMPEVLYCPVLDSLFSTHVNTEKTGSCRNGFAILRTAFYDAVLFVFLVENTGILPARKSHS